MNSKIAVVVFAVVALASICAAVEDYQQVSEDRHNELRAKHGSQAISLDAELNRLAEGCAADYLARDKIDHKCAHELKKGENLYKAWTSGDAPAATEAMADAIQSWYDENNGYNYNDPGNSQGVTGHFTQTVWDASVKVGCGVSSQAGNTVAACLYDPPGNMKDYDGGYSFYVQNVHPPQ